MPAWAELKGLASRHCCSWLTEFVGLDASMSTVNVQTMQSEHQSLVQYGMSARVVSEISLIATLHSHEKKLCQA